MKEKSSLMKALALFAITFAFTISVSASEVFECGGIRGTKGELKLEVNGAFLKVSGGYLDWQTHKTIPARFSGKLDRATGRFSYYRLSRSTSLAEMLVRTPSEMNPDGMIALIFLNGDSNAGYEYEHFFCSKK